MNMRSLFLVVSLSSLFFGACKQINSETDSAKSDAVGKMTVEQKWDMVKRFAAKIPVKQACEFNYHVEDLKIIEDKNVVVTVCDDRNKCGEIWYNKILFTTGEAKIFVSEDNEYRFSFDWKGGGNTTTILSEMIFETHHNDKGQVVPRVKLTYDQHPNGYSQWISCDLKKAP